jgi:hypothetical protein
MRSWWCFIISNVSTQKATTHIASTITLSYNWDSLRQGPQLLWLPTWMMTLSKMRLTTCNLGRPTRTLLCTYNSALMSWVPGTLTLTTTNCLDLKLCWVQILAGMTERLMTCCPIWEILEASWKSSKFCWESLLFLSLAWGCKLCSQIDSITSHKIVKIPLKR